MRTRLLILAVIAGGALCGTRLLAHHSFAAEFDGSKSIRLTGSLTKIEWQNPHTWFYMDVKDDKGSLQHWQCEGGAPNTLTRNGWSRS